MAKTLQQQSALYRQSALYFSLLVPLAIAGFWPSYYSHFTGIGSVRVHIHGAAMSLWCLLLISQAFWIRAGLRPLHRRLGQLSYVLVPVIALSTLAMAQHRLAVTTKPQDWPDVLYFLYVQLQLLAVFLVAYGFAILRRRQPLEHARYMVCTALTLIDPIVARLLFNLWNIDFPLEQVITYALTDAILLALVLWDRRQGSHSRVFAGMLAVFLLAQLPTFFVSQFPAWRAFADWLAGVAV